MSGFRATKVISDKGLTATVDCTREVNQRIAELEQQLAELHADELLAGYIQQERDE